MQRLQIKITKNGFTVIELILGIAVMAILSVTAIVYMRSAITSVSSDAAVRDLTVAIRGARGHAVAGDLGAAWGVRTVHGAGGVDRFEIFATTTGSTMSASSSLPGNEVHQLLPGANWGEGVDRSIIFYPATSTTTPATFLIKYSGGTAQIVVNESGDITIQ